VTPRDDILARIRLALADVPLTEAPGDVPVPHDYRRSHVDPGTGVVDLFVARVADYRATVTRVPPGGVAAAITAAVGDLIAVVPDGFPAGWLPARPGGGWLGDEPALTTAELDRVGVAVTTAAIGIAVTGTIVLDAGAGQGRRALTLVPDAHVCVIRADRIAPDVPDALARLDPAAPLTFISGPSATSDIELQRVEGVHGPRNLHVIVVEEANP
jgi:L-lactate dehydrogenase complex protein LldG